MDLGRFLHRRLVPVLIGLSLSIGQGGAWATMVGADFGAHPSAQTTATPQKIVPLLGALLSLEGDALRVTAVANTSEAQRGGLTRGDLIELPAGDGNAHARLRALLAQLLERKAPTLALKVKKPGGIPATISLYVAKQQTALKLAMGSVDAGVKTTPSCAPLPVPPAPAFPNIERLLARGIPAGACIGQLVRVETPAPAVEAVPPPVLLDPGAQARSFYALESSISRISQDVSSIAEDIHGITPKPEAVLDAIEAAWARHWRPDNDEVIWDDFNLGVYRDTLARARSVQVVIAVIDGLADDAHRAGWSGTAVATRISELWTGRSASPNLHDPAALQEELEAIRAEPPPETEVESSPQDSTALVQAYVKRLDAFGERIHALIPNDVSAEEPNRVTFELLARLLRRFPDYAGEPTVTPPLPTQEPKQVREGLRRYTRGLDRMLKLLTHTLDDLGTSGLELSLARRRALAAWELYRGLEPTLQQAGELPQRLQQLRAGLAALVDEPAPRGQADAQGIGCAGAGQKVSAPSQLEKLLEETPDGGRIELHTKDSGESWQAIRSGRSWYIESYAAPIQQVH